MGLFESTIENYEWVSHTHRALGAFQVAGCGRHASSFVLIVNVVLISVEKSLQGTVVC